MIYFITKNINIHLDSTAEAICNKDSKYNRVIISDNVNLAIDYFTVKILKNPKDYYIGVDTETESLNPRHGGILTIQIGDEENQFVIDLTTVQLVLFKDLLVSSNLIFHNYKFDSQFLFYNDIYPDIEKIYDSYISEIVITNGKLMARRSYKEVVHKYCKEHIVKDIRASISRNSIYTNSFIVYAAKDVEYLPKVKAGQEEIIRNLKIEKCISLENQFTTVLAYIVHCGFKLDQEKWKRKMMQDEAALFLAKDKLDTLYLLLNLDKLQNQQTLFVNVNWNSSDQVIPIMKQLGVDTKVYDKKTKKYKESIESTVLKKYKHIEFVKAFLDYNKLQKKVSTYGDNVLKAANSYPDGRIRTRFNQILSTGRLSSGGKDEYNNNIQIKNINFQNIPRTPEKPEEGAIYDRQCFIPEEGYSFVVADYSQQEQVVLANISKEKNLIEFFTSGKENDMHSFNARAIYPELKNLTAGEIKKNHADKRFNAKGAGFAINYGGVASTIADSLNIDISLANEIYTNYLKSFPDLSKYFKEQANYAERHGYIRINNVTNRIFFFDKGVDSRQKSINFPIQGTSADMMKLAGVFIFKYVFKNNLLSKVKFVNKIHDEYVFEVEENYADEFAHVVKHYMEKASSIFCPIIKVKADPFVGKSWEH